MRLLVLGSGLMGPAAVYNAMSDPQVMGVTLCDADQGQLESTQEKLSKLEGAEKLSTLLLDLNDERAAIESMGGFDAVVGALPWRAVTLGLRAALAAGRPVVDLARPHEAELPDLKREVESAGGLVILGCGVEPGLTEILARYLAEKLDEVNELHIKVGGIPERPTPPLGYKIVFGGRQLPLKEADAYIVEDGSLSLVPRYSGVERVSFPGVGECEAWHEGFMPWLMELEALKGLKLGTQKTIRWPGYAAKATVLKELGLLSQEPVDVDGISVSPKSVVDAVLYPRVRLEEGERDMTLFRVEAVGARDGVSRRLKMEMVDRYDEELGFTSMARTTAFTGAIVARMIARGDLKARGLFTPEQVITGPLLERLLAELAEEDVRFRETTEDV